MHTRYRRRASPCVAAFVLLAVVTFASAEQQVRVATYNIKFLNTEISPARRERIRSVIELLDADIIGLQEIADRAALENIFEPDEWDIVIDDDSGNNQDVAVVVRHPLRVRDLPADLDADDEHFLFSGSGNDHMFPNRRDVLCVPVVLAESAPTLFILVHHAKARVGGRDVTDPRREDAARALLDRLERDFDEKAFIVVGDMNDACDDRSMNILESGQPDAAGGPEEIEGPFLLNLCEPLIAQDRVSWGLRGGSVSNGVINTVKPGSRARNNAERGTGGSVSPILFDQILMPMSLKTAYVVDSARIFDQPVAVNSGPDAASDHLPVFADFVFAEGEETPASPSGPPNGVVIAELLPDPDGEDRGREWVVLANLSAAPVDLSGWRLEDRSDHIYELSGSINGGARLKVSLPANILPLNNSGDDIRLYDARNQLINQRTYSASHVVRGEPITFE